jgi:hypothetical protein
MLTTPKPDNSLNKLLNLTGSTVPPPRARAAGGKVTSNGTSTIVTLPADLPNGMGLAELKRVAGEQHVEVQQGARA